MANLFHISGWSRLSHASAGDEFSLLPGHQAVEGRGVYFAEGSIPPMTTAEGSRGGVSAVVAISAESAVGWWRTKPSLSRKFGRPRTWHSDRKSLVCRVVEVGTADVAGTGVPILFCSWRFATKANPKKGSAVVVRPRGWKAAGDEARVWLDSLSSPGVVFRGMTSDEYRNTVGRQRDIMSTARYSSNSEGTCFTDDAASAESYANFGADDPRITGKPTYLVEVAKTRSMYRDRDGYDKDRSPVPYGNVIRVWEMYADDGAILARRLNT
jgi:hypothetical protein